MYTCRKVTGALPTHPYVQIRSARCEQNKSATFLGIMYSSSSSARRTSYAAACHSSLPANTTANKHCSLLRRNLNGTVLIRASCMCLRSPRTQSICLRASCLATQYQISLRAYVRKHLQGKYVHECRPRCPALSIEPARRCGMVAMHVGSHISCPEMLGSRQLACVMR